MENFQTVCKEGEASVDEEERDEITSIMEGVEDEDYIQTLLDRELASGGIQVPEGGDWILQGRLGGIHYILEKREFLGLRFRTAYLSAAYLDGFLSRKPIAAEKPWTIKLLSMACLSLAAKMEESTVIPLSGFRWKDFNFESRHVLRMELLVLNTLDWRTALVTPLEFIHFFVKKLYGNSSRNGVSRIVELILHATRNEKIMCHKPSVIGASATLVALDSGLTRVALGLKISPLTSSGVLEIEDCIACYDQIMGLEWGNLKPNQEIKSPKSSPSCSHRVEGGDDTNSSANLLYGPNRRSLEFKESDQIDDVPNKNQNQ
ncbi:cyclin-D5-1-like [Primulina tabacum]|uniref:cyclin-D5-1-like n=1 Tax=Primulina tabacum TaxID=48773 RepID=UPI003F5A0828